MYPFVLGQIFAVFFAIAKNSANISEKICADIYENIRVAKNCASLIFPQIFSQILAQIFAEINLVLKIPQIFAILFAVIIAMRKYYRKTKCKFLRIANKSAKRSANESAK